MRKIAQHTREMAAQFCSARASAEAAGIKITNYGSGRCAGHVFDAHMWTREEGKLAHAAFMSVIDDGVNPRQMADNWGEAEAWLRCGEFP